MLRVAAYLAGGIAVLLATDYVAATTGFLGTDVSAPAEIQAGTIDRSLKGDRLTVLRPAEMPRRTVAASDSRMLFRAAPPANVTVIVKGSVLPRATTRPASERDQRLGRPAGEPSRGVDRLPAGVPAAAPERKLMDGCDPSFSPVAAPNLAHITGRCIARIKDTHNKFAALHH